MALHMDIFDSKPLPISTVDRHLLVVGQSGSGKSYFIGKLIEELVCKTNARIVVLDRAGDFISMRLAADRSTVLEIPIAVHSHWSSSGLTGLPKFQDVSVHPFWFNAIDLCAAFGLPLEPSYWGLLGAAQRALLSRKPYPLNDLMKELHGHDTDHQSSLTISPSELGKLLESIDNVTEGLFSKFAYRDPSSDLTIPDTPTKVIEAKNIQVVDLSCFGGEHSRSVLTSAVLQAVWNDGRNQWWNRHLTNERQERTPTFVVVDEAHHVCSSDDPESTMAARVREQILEIATEGRKYGVWLVCGTQRPLRLHRTVLAESGNFLIMKTISPGDQGFIADNLLRGIKPAKLGQLKQGEGYLAGAWANGSNGRVKVAQRRTLHPEGGFEASEWVRTGALRLQ